MSRSVLTLGLQKTGKTTFLAAFWDVVETGLIPDALKLEQTSGDMEYLNEIRAAWADCKNITRTGPASDRPISMLLAVEGGVAELAWTDMLGESFERQWTDREWTRGYQSLARDAVGLILFVHPRQIKEPALIIEALPARLALDPQAAIGTQPEVADASPGDKADPFDLRNTPTQVQLVDLVQFVDEVRSGGDPLRLSVVISAWDFVTKTLGNAIQPDAWFEKSVPLLWQFLSTNPERFEMKIFGVSAQGGDYKDAKELRKAVRPSDRIRVREAESESQDITLPVRWALGGNVT